MYWSFISDILDISFCFLVKFYIFVFGLGKPMSKTYCSIASQSPPQVKEHIINIGTAPHTGADIPYLMMVCGEP